jgi:hypothetical protein
MPAVKAGMTIILAKSDRPTQTGGGSRNLEPTTGLLIPIIVGVAYIGRGLAGLGIVMIRPTVPVVHQHAPMSAGIVDVRRNLIIEVEEVNDILTVTVGVAGGGACNIRPVLFGSAIVAMLEPTYAISGTID